MPHGFGLRALATSALVSALIGGSAAGQAPSGASWEPINTKQACAIHQGPVLIGTPDGKHFALFVSGLQVGGQPMRPVTIDEKPYLLSFTQVNQMAMADLDPATLGAMATGAHLSLDGPSGKIEVVTSGLMPALNAAQACGANLQAKQVAAAQARARAQRSSQELDAFMAQMPGPAPIVGMPPMPGVSTQRTALAGTTCFKKREWSSGFNKNCAYDCLGSEAVQTIGSAELCPATIASPR